MTSEKPKKILIFGIGRGADSGRRYFQADTRHEIVGYVVDREFPNARRVA